MPVSLHSIARPRRRLAPAAQLAALAMVMTGAGLVALSAVAASPAVAATGEAIAWRHAASDADVDAAFALARAASKPVFVYWGASWCPPCNQVKSTIFNRQDFIERSRAFVPVYVDGDSPGAQKLGARFHVSGYPTMLLFRPDGQEVTRLPGEVDARRYAEVLDLGMAAARPVKTLLADALAGRPLAASDWQLLAFYSYDTDQQQLVAKDRVAATLARLADACPADQPATAMRLRLKALAASGDDPHRRLPDARVRAALLSLLADAAAAREQADLLVNWAPEIVRAASARGSSQRSGLVAGFDVALKRLQLDASLSRADRMQALISRVELARLDHPEGPAPRLAPALLAEAREAAARADREISDGYERQAVITAAAYLLERAGLSRDSDALLESNLAKSHSPYYLMSELASNARQRGDRRSALRWYALAFEKSEGPATRLQWGASYLGALVDLAPDGEATIEATAAQIWREAAAQPDAFYERSGRSLQRIGSKLQAWSRGGRHAAAMARLRADLAALCTAADRRHADPATCAGLLGPAPRGA